MAPKASSSAQLRTGLAGIAALAAIVIAGTSPGASAPVIRGLNYNDQQFLACASADCSINFAQIPANRFLTITNVTCDALTRNVGNIPRLAITAQGDLGRQQFLVPVFMGNRASGADTIREYIANNEVYYLVQPSTFPRARIVTFGAAGSVVSLDCSIAGLLKAV